MPGAGGASGGDEPRRADLLEDRLHRRGAVERAARRDRLRARVGTLCEQHGDGAGMAGLDRDDRRRGAQERLALQPAGLPEVGPHARVFENERRREERRLILVGALKIKRRGLHRLAAERLDGLPQRRNVRRLVVGHERGEFERVAADRVRLDGALVERGLQVLERQRVVEDLEVLSLRRLSGSQLGQHREESARAENRSPADGGLAEERRAGITSDGGLGLGHPAVGVNGGNRQRGHPVSPDERMTVPAAITQQRARSRGATDAAPRTAPSAASCCPRISPRSSWRENAQAINTWMLYLPRASLSLTMWSMRRTAAPALARCWALRSSCG